LLNKKKGLVVFEFVKNQIRTRNRHLASSSKFNLTTHQAPHFNNPFLTQQQPLGNQATQRFAESCPLALPSPTLYPFGGVCHTCPARVQAKLTVNKPGDKYEQEANRVAEHVMQMPEPHRKHQKDKEAPS
jgi:hypothetical protein